MSPILVEAKQYLWRHGCATDTVTDPIELIRDLAIELEKHEGVPVEIRIKKPKARAKPR
jgi:hypothetical protein